MGKTSLMIRMIDVVFILLFGFIAISQIDTTTLIDPPRSTEASEGAPENANTIVIGVKNDGTYHADGGMLTMTRIEQLQNYLFEKARQAESKGAVLGVRIRADWDSPVEQGLAVVRLCRDLGLAKGLDVMTSMTE
ncbi:MAG: ExbD/TolR family protein [Candidatus Zhuqueibacterota bacterium]